MSEKLYALLAYHVRRNKERFTARLLRNLRSTEGGCLEWAGAVNDTGYPRANFRDREGRHVQIKMHQAFWVLINRRPIPKGFDIDHTCCNRRCVRHLQAVPVHDNRVRLRTFRARQLAALATASLPFDEGLDNPVSL